MKILISPKSAEEAKNCVIGGADIIDVKRPEEGSLGANFPIIIEEIKRVIPKNMELSATLGDCPYLPGTISQAAVGAALAGADYVKCGLRWVKTTEEAEFMMKNIVHNVKHFFPKIKIVVSGYADYERAECISIFELPAVARKASADGVLIDTAFKDKRLLEILSEKQLRKMVDLCHKNKVFSALAGKVTKEDALILKKTGVDIIGVRSAVCEGKNRIEGKITEEKVKEFVNYVKG
jgi:uncharacterized protein (UPF0264 family)